MNRPEDHLRTTNTHLTPTDSAVSIADDYEFEDDEYYYDGDEYYYEEDSEEDQLSPPPSCRLSAVFSPSCGRSPPPLAATGAPGRGSLSIKAEPSAGDHLLLSLPNLSTPSFLLDLVTLVFRLPPPPPSGIAR